MEEREYSMSLLLWWLLGRDGGGERRHRESLLGEPIEGESEKLERECFRAAAVTFLHRDSGGVRVV